MKTTEKIYRLMNHDNYFGKAEFESFELSEYNEQFGTDYATIEDAVGDDPEYLFTQCEMEDFNI